MEKKNIDQDDKEKAAKFLAYKKEHKAQIEAWLKAHPHGPIPPIYFNEQLGNFRWLSRQERRANPDIKPNQRQILTPEDLAKEERPVKELILPK